MSHLSRACLQLIRDKVKVLYWGLNTLAYKANVNCSPFLESRSCLFLLLFMKFPLVTFVLLLLLALVYHQLTDASSTGLITSAVMNPFFHISGCQLRI